MFNLAGALVYLLVAAAAIACARRETGGAAARWWSIAATFVLLAGWRLLHGEDQVQAWLRHAAEASGTYETRTAWQGPLASLAVLGGAALLYWLSRRGVRDSAWIVLARLATASLAGFTAVRAMSFHPIDQLIYLSVGPLHLNHVIDIGLSFLAGGAAIAEFRQKNAAGRRKGLSR